MDIKPLNLIDGYKVDHRRQYPEETEYVYSNLTPRNSRIKGVDSIVWFGLQYFVIEYLIKLWKQKFFDIPLEAIVEDYKRRIDNYLGPDCIPLDHIIALHNLKYLPLRIKSLPEGTIVPIGVPVLTIVNTHPDFFWLTNYFETIMSNILWKGSTSATTAYHYRKRFEEHAAKTGYDTSFIQWQGHDFSFRGMSGIEDAVLSGAGHLLSFTGTDTIPAIDFLEEYYRADCEKELIGGSVPATEHSVMSMGSKESEIETFRRLITELYPSGIVSIVSDTWNLWAVLTEYLPVLKEEILARDGRVVIRPDSGDPVDIICGIKGAVQHKDGKYYYYTGNPDETFGNFAWHEVPEVEAKGVYELLWDIFGGTINEKGYKILNPKIGMIYGDAITRDRQDEIFNRLEAKGFAFSNGVLGIGSFTYEYVTRDTYGFAMKATWGQVNGEEREIFKDPVTDTGFKKSAKGRLMVCKDQNGVLKLEDQCLTEDEREGELITVFYNGSLTSVTSLETIRKRLWN